MNEVENVRYVHSDRSWIAALFGGLAGAILGATLMGVIALMMWTMRQPVPSTAPTNRTLPDTTEAYSGSNMPRTTTSQTESSAVRVPATERGQRSSARFEARPKNDDSDSEAQPTSVDAEPSVTDDATSTMPEHGPMSKATIDAYRLPGAEPE